MNSLLAAWRKLSTLALAYGNRLVAALTDIRRSERNAGWLLLVYLAVWTIYAIIQKSSQDINFDMGEVVVWSRELATGSPKHPPLAGWIVRLWFAVFPLTDWAYYLLAIANATVALWVAWFFSKRWLDPEKRVAGLALLTLVPFFNFLAIKFNPNTVLIPFWALTAYCFLISYSTRSLLFAALAGAGAGACMLGKYWSIFLIAGLAIAALVDSRRRDYFRSWAPWITIAAGTVVIAPHIIWLLHNHFSSFEQPLKNHGGYPLSFSVKKSFLYVVGFIAYISAPLLLVWLAARPTIEAVKDSLWPQDADRRLAALAFWLPIILPIPAALLLHAELTALWTMSAVGLLPVVLLSSDRIVLTRNAIAAIVAIAVALPLVALIASPFASIADHLEGPPHHGGQYRLLANEIEKNWHAMTDQPLRLVGGPPTLGNGTAFYLSDRPSAVNIFRRDRTPWADDARIKREGIAVICRGKDQLCMDKFDILARIAPEDRRIDVTVARSYLGLKGKPASYTLIFIAPEKR